MVTRRAAVVQLVAGAASLACTRSAFSQDGKTTITVLVGAASLMDYTARLIAEQLHESLGRTAVVLSKLGAGQRLALAEVRRAAPDGRTLVFATNGPFAIYPHIYTKLDYDPVADFTPIAGIGLFDVAIAAGPMTQAADVKQAIEWARARPNDAVFGSAPGNGSLSHFLGLATALATGVRMTHIPYKDSGVGITDLIAGRLPLMITGLTPLAEMHKAGRLKILAVSGDKRSALVPEVPTLKEAGVDVSTTTSTGVFGPPKMPRELVMRYHAAITPMLSDAVIREKLQQQGMTPWSATPTELAASLASDRKRFEALVKATGYVAEAA